LISMYVDPDHSDVNAFSNEEINGRASTSTMRIDPRGTLLVVTGVRSPELEYTPDVGGDLDLQYPYSKSTYSSTDPDVGNAVARIAFSAGTTVQSFWCEIIEHIEYIGPITAGSGNMSHVDPNGFSAVNAADAATRNDMAGRPYTAAQYASSFARSVGNVLRDFTPDSASVGRVAGGIAVGALRGIGSRQRGGLAMQF
jgi:hypothetical protein